jgi:DNA replication and repair protein RecF
VILKKISAVNFRNYEKLEAEFNGKFNFIYGDNGHGKTNILEAISLISFAKSFLGSSESDCIKFGCAEFIVQGEYVNDRDHVSIISSGYDNINRKKTFHLNKEKVSRISSEVFGKFPVVFLSPHSLNITYGNPSERRKFFDILISQASSLYLDNLKTLAKLLKQKNALLKNNLQYRSYAPQEMRDLLNSYNEKLVDVSADIIFRRLKFLEEFKAYFERNFSYLISGENYSFIDYVSDMYGEINYEMMPGFTRERVSGLVKASIDEKTGEEIGRGMSLTGPQRDDYGFKLRKGTGEESFDVFDLKNHASQGEHKTFIVALKLAEFDYLKEKKGTSPILLLDDILSELDAGRVSKIIAHLKDFGQIFLTTTERSYLKDIESYYAENEISVFKVNNGVAVKE